MTTMTFSPNTIYKDLMKRVHPDLHPTMPNATAKAQAVNAAKGNIQMLKTLAITWGFLQGQTVTPRNPFDRTAYPRPDMNNTFTRPRPVRPTYRSVIIKTLNDLNLIPNRDYSDRRIMVTIKIHGRVSTHILVRTTKKCVVVSFFGMDKVVKMANVVGRV